MVINRNIILTYFSINPQREWSKNKVSLDHSVIWIHVNNDVTLSLQCTQTEQCCSYFLLGLFFIRLRLFRFIFVISWFGVVLLFVAGVFFGLLNRWCLKFSSRYCDVLDEVSGTSFCYKNEGRFATFTF